MKPFDKAAAKRGATVCIGAGFPVRILCFDLAPDNYIVAAIKSPDGYESVGIFRSSGEFIRSCRIEDNLFMADNDYLEKLERGEYGNATIEAPVWQGPYRIMTPEDIAKVTFLSPFDESYWRKMYIGMAMQGLMAAHGTMKPSDMIAKSAIEYADALIEQLKKTQK